MKIKFQKKLKTITVKICLLITLTFVSVTNHSQSGIIKGSVVDATNNETIPFANIFIENINSGVSSDIDGNYIIKNLKPGLYNLTCSFVGYKSKSFSEIIVSSNKNTCCVTYPTKESDLNNSPIRESSINISPFVGFNNPTSRLINVLFPEPDLPVIPMKLPFGISISTRFKSGFLEYENSTFLKIIE